MSDSKSKSIKKPTLKVQIQNLEISLKEENDKFLRLFVNLKTIRKEPQKKD